MPISMTLSSGSFRLIIFTLIHTPHNGDCPRGWCPLSPVWVCALCSFAPSLATHWQYLEATAGAVSRLCKLSAEQQQLDIFNLAKQNNNLCKANIYSSGNKNRGIEQNELPMVPDELNVSNSRNKKEENQNNPCHQLQINGVNIFSKTSGLCSKCWDKSFIFCCRAACAAIHTLVSKILLSAPDAAYVHSECRHWSPGYWTAEQLSLTKMCWCAAGTAALQSSFIQ